MKLKRVTTRLPCLIFPLWAIALVAEPGITQSMPQPHSDARLAPATRAQATPPMDFLDQPEGAVNCVASGTSNTVPWDHRFTYWLSGIAQFDEQGNMQPIPDSRSKDWLLTITNSRIPTPTSYHLSPLGEQTGNPEFSFPAVSQEEWEQLGKQPSRRYTTALSNEEASYGLYVAIRNTEAVPTPRQMFQVIHHLSDDIAIRTEASPCFIGPRPPSPLELSDALNGTEPRTNLNLEVEE